MRSGIVDALTRAACTLCLLGNILPAAAITVGSTVLILARDDAEAKGAAMGLDGYGIPYQKVIFPAGGANLPVLNSSATQGNYGGIVVISNVAYDNNGTFASALTPQQWAQINSYQSTFKVRMVRINEFPSAEFGELRGMQRRYSVRFVLTFSKVPSWPILLSPAVAEATPSKRSVSPIFPSFPGQISKRTSHSSAAMQRSTFTRTAPCPPET